MNNQEGFYDEETREWMQALDDIIQSEGPEKASFILSKLAERLTQKGSIPSFNLTTPFRNSIPLSEEARMPGELFMERKIRSFIRWNALAMVLRANKNEDEHVTP